MTEPGFRYEERAGVARVTLDRPHALNALTFESYRGLVETFEALTRKPEIRVVVLTGAGRAFCTGGDVKEIIGPLLGREAGDLLVFTRQTCALVRAMRTAPQPIVAALNGVAAGAGAALALASDFRIAADTARIAFLFVKVGLAGADMGAAYLLPRLVGLGRATELLMTGDFVEPADALRMGLYHRVVEGAQLDDAVEELVMRLARGPRRALALTKAALELEGGMSLDRALEHEAAVQAELMAEPDFHEGFLAFVGKRPPRFEGGPE